MFRKALFTAAATGTLGLALAVPTAAFARDWHHDRDWHRWHRPAVSVRIGSAYAYAPDCYFVRRWVHNRFGWHLRRVEVCR
ncbi:MAG TPA: hypothetical protein VFA53_02070 [Xanthobacteraceae bacterium]|nr:hypothetical protein [Xanthobacteraceae bacterium]